MAAAAQTAAAAAAEAAAVGFDLCIVNRKCRRLERRDTLRRAAVLRRLRRHSTRWVLTVSVCFALKALRHDGLFGHLTIEPNDGKGLEKSGWFWIFQLFMCVFGFLTLVIGRLRIPVFGRTTNHPLRITVVSDSSICLARCGRFPEEIRSVSYRSRLLFIHLFNLFVSGL